MAFSFNISRKVDSLASPFTFMCVCPTFMQAWTLEWNLLIGMGEKYDGKLKPISLFYPFSLPCKTQIILPPTPSFSLPKWLKKIMSGVQVILRFCGCFWKEGFLLIKQNGSVDYFFIFHLLIDVCICYYEPLIPAFFSPLKQAGSKLVLAQSVQLLGKIFRPVLSERISPCWKFLL